MIRNLLKSWLPTEHNFTKDNIEKIESSPMMESSTDNEKMESSSMMESSKDNEKKESSPTMGSSKDNDVKEDNVKDINEVKDVDKILPKLSENDEEKLPTERQYSPRIRSRPCRVLSITNQVLFGLFLGLILLPIFQCSPTPYPGYKPVNPKS